MNRLILTCAALATLTACSPAPTVAEDVALAPVAEIWGIAETAVISSETVPNGDGTTTTTLQFFGAPVSDDEMADAPSLICEETGTRVKSSTVRSPTAMEALADGTLMMIVTCGA
jgi:hypothetical protein